MSEARRLAAALGGRWHGQYGTAACPVCQGDSLGDKNALTLTDGRRGLLLNCKKSGCTFLDILSAANVPTRCRHQPAPSSGRRKHDVSSSEFARKLWAASQPIEGSPAAVYLRSVRMVDLPTTPSLRFSARTWHGPTRQNLPAIIALVDGVDDFAVSRTYLQPDGSGKADLAAHEQKLMLGRAAGGHVALMTGRDCLIVGEGLETTMSLPHLGWGFSATLWATLTAANMRSLRLPSTPGHLAIATDGDGAGRSAGNALAARAIQLGWTVEIRSAPDGRDWNDVLIGRRTSAEPRETVHGF